MGVTETPPIRYGMFPEVQATARLVPGSAEAFLVRENQASWGPLRAAQRGVRGDRQALQPVPDPTRTSSISTYWKARPPGRS